MACFSTPPLLDAPASENFWVKLTLQKLSGWGYRTVKIAQS